MRAGGEEKTSAGTAAVVVIVVVGVVVVVVAEVAEGVATEEVGEGVTEVLLIDCDSL